MALASKSHRPRVRARSRLDIRQAVFLLSCEVYSWIRMIMSLLGLIFLAVMFLAPQFSLSSGTIRRTPTADQLMSCYAVEGTRNTWVCDSPLGSRLGSSNGGTLLTQ